MSSSREAKALEQLFASMGREFGQRYLTGRVSPALKLRKRPGSGSRSGAYGPGSFFPRAARKPLETKGAP